MTLDPWLPIGYELARSTRVRRTVLGGDDWQVVETDNEERVLLARPALTAQWSRTGLVSADTFTSARFGRHQFEYLVSEPHHILTAVNEAERPRTKSEALAFATALRESRSLDPDSPLQDALYVEKLTRLLPCYSISSRTPDDVILGFWLSGGAPISAQSFRRLHQAVSWLGVDHLKDVVEAAGFAVDEVLATDRTLSDTGEALRASVDTASPSKGMAEPFSLPGRPELERFINEHIVDVLRDRARYKALGIGFPSAVILHGPPGSGKTFAVERLIEYLGWPSYNIDASSVASPFIHETSKKVAGVFETAQENAPSVLVIDEMEAFLADREAGAGHHRVEEVAEFLRRIPEAKKHDVLIIAMTNRLDMIDPAILRRGRFDHHISVGYASQSEVHALVDKLLSELPTAGPIDTYMLAEKLSDRPLSDVTFVVREGARLAARAGKAAIDQESLMAALGGAPPRSQDSGAPRRVGFI
jgi:Cdc6-like AAA superfamily ATPase